MALKSPNEWSKYITRCMTGDCDIWVAKNWRPGDRGIITYRKFHNSKFLIHCMLQRGNKILDARGSLPVENDLSDVLSKMLMGSAAEGCGICFYSIYDTKELFAASIFIEHHRYIPNKYISEGRAIDFKHLESLISCSAEYQIEVPAKHIGEYLSLSVQIQSASSRAAESRSNSNTKTKEPKPER